MSKFINCVVEGCNQEVHAVYAEKHNGQCIKCVGKTKKDVSNLPPSREELNQLFRKKVTRAGHASCGCGALIPNSKVDEWNGKCPKCNGVEQKPSRVVVDNKFKSLEEFKAQKG